MRVGMYRFVLHGWHQGLRGYSSVLAFSQVISSHAGSCFIFYESYGFIFKLTTKFSLKLQDSVTNITSLSKSTASFMQFLKR